MHTSPYLWYWIVVANDINNLPIRCKVFHSKVPHGSSEPPPGPLQLPALLGPIRLVLGSLLHSIRVVKDLLRSQGQVSSLGPCVPEEAVTLAKGTSGLTGLRPGGMGWLVARQEGRCGLMTPWPLGPGISTMRERL